MKNPNDLFGRLPTVSDLMENPRIKGLVDRIQEMEVTAGVSHYVERLRREISRRTIDYPIPSITELADRAARFIIGRQASTHRQIINATGQLWPAGVVAPALAEEAITAMSAHAQHMHQIDGRGTSDLVADLAGAQSAKVYSSPMAAALAALESVSVSRRVVIARAEMGTLEGNLRIADLAEYAGIEFIEVGASDAVSLEDYERSIGEEAVLLRVESLPHVVRGQITRPSISELATLAKNHGTALIHHIGRGALTPLPEPIEIGVENAASSIHAGTSLVIARGDGYLGGPRCGLVLGNHEVIAKLDTPLAQMMACDPLIETALHATLAMWDMPDRAALNIPTLSLLSTPIENLESRANRIAAQLSQVPGIDRADAIKIEAATDLGGNRPLPSFGVSIQYDNDQKRQLTEKLDLADPRVLASWSDDRLLLDLRTVAPGDDIALVTAFEGESTDSVDEE